MKKIISTTSILIIMLSFFACTPKKCNKLITKQVTLLIDCSDPALDSLINADISTNFGSFMGRAGLGTLAPCNKLVVNILPISGSEDLDIASASIQFDEINVSQDKIAAMQDPTPILNLLKQKLDDYKKLSLDTNYNKETSIINTIVKAINQLNSLADTSVYIVFSDGIENSLSLNMYRHVPNRAEMYKSIDTLIEKSELKKLKDITPPTVILVQKEDVRHVTNRHAVKEYWANLFNALHLPYQVIDNLTNNINQPIN